MFERNAILLLKNWAVKENRKPLILRGARQVGKTTLINDFSKNFDTYLYINLEDSFAKSIFEKNGSIEDVLTSIYLYCNQERNDGKVLLFIDEIQNSPNAVAKLRYFFEQLSHIYVIAAGSLLENMIDKHISFPVGRVEFMAIRPCSFSEFLGAIGEIELKKAIINGTVPEMIHEKTMSFFNKFTLLGGMPEVIANYAKNRDLVAINAIYESLLSGYKDDVEKYSKGNTMIHVIRHILNNGWSYAAETITLACFGGSAYRSREVGGAFRTLEKTLLLELVYPSVSFEIPINGEIKRSPKLIWFDTGLVNYAAKIQKELFGASDIQDAWRGRIVEQIVAQELIANDYKVSSKRNFWVRDKKGTSAEVDFIIQFDNKIIPIEVKSGHNAKLKSLHIFMENTNHDIAVRVWSNPFSIDKITTKSGKQIRLYNIPFYLVGSLEKVLIPNGNI